MPSEALSQEVRPGGVREAPVIAVGQPAGPLAVPGAAAAVNQTPITIQELEAALDAFLARSFGHRQLSEARIAEIKKEVLEDLIQKELLYQEAKRQGIQVSPQEIETEVTKIRKRFPSEEEFLAALKKSDLTLGKVRFGVERFIAGRKILAIEVDSKVIIHEGDLADYYEANQQRFVLPEEREIRQILITVDPGGSTKDWEAGLKKANEIFKKIKEGQDFSGLARMVSDDASTRDQGGSLGFLSRGRMRVKELEEAAFAMQVGEVSHPVKTLYGYFILQVEGVRPSRPLKLSEVNQDLLRDEVRAQAVEERRRQWLNAIRAKADIRVFP